MFSMANSAIFVTLILAAPLLATACSPTEVVTVGDNLNSAIPPSAFPSFNPDGSYSIYAPAEVQAFFANQVPRFRNSSRSPFQCVDARGTTSVRHALCALAVACPVRNQVPSQ